MNINYYFIALEKEIKRIKASIGIIDGVLNIIRQDFSEHKTFDSDFDSYFHHNHEFKIKEKKNIVYCFGKIDSFWQQEEPTGPKDMVTITELQDILTKEILFTKVHKNITDTKWCILLKEDDWFCMAAEITDTNFLYPKYVKKVRNFEEAEEYIEKIRIPERV